MNKKETEKKIDKNRSLINNALNSDLDIEMLNIIVGGLSLSNEVLIHSLKIKNHE